MSEQSQKDTTGSNPKTLNEWASAIHELANEKGWWDTDRTPLEVHALIHSEVSEATEEIRDAKPRLYFYSRYVAGDYEPKTFDEALQMAKQGRKPQGQAIELLDGVIRTLDALEKQGCNVQELMLLKHEYNKTRPYRHGGKTA